MPEYEKTHCSCSPLSRWQPECQYRVTAILNNSSSIIVSHQHPSGDVHPSREDIEVMKRLVECGRILGIEVLDQLIVNDKDDYYSMKEKG